MKRQKTQAKPVLPQFFSHPDYTVGFGIAPNQPNKARRLLLPVGNFTPPQRIFIKIVIL
jgi:hypothetical protein